MKKKTFKIPVTWEEYGFIEVEANNIHEAIEMVREDDMGNGENFPLPDEHDYVDGTFKIPSEYTEEDILFLFNAKYETLKREDNPKLYDALADFGKKVFDIDKK